MPWLAPLPRSNMALALSFSVLRWVLSRYPLPSSTVQGAAWVGSRTDITALWMQKFLYVLSILLFSRPQGHISRSPGDTSVTDSFTALNQPRQTRRLPGSIFIIFLGVFSFWFSWKCFSVQLCFLFWNITFCCQNEEKKSVLHSFLSDQNDGEQSKSKSKFLNF